MASESIAHEILPNLKSPGTPPNRDFYFQFKQLQLCVLAKHPFPSCLKPLFKREAKKEAIDMKTTFYSHAEMRLIFATSRKVLQSASF